MEMFQTLCKKKEDLDMLKESGLDLVYIGFESGDDKTLKRIKKGATKEETVEAMQKLKKSGIKVSGMVLLGVGEKKEVLSMHIKQLTCSQEIEYVGLSLQVRPGAPLYKDKDGIFELPDKYQLLKELEIIAENTELSGGYFYSNHISNYLPIKAIFKDKERGRI